MALGKNFRLPNDARAVRYTARLDLDLAKGAFAGHAKLELTLAAPRRRLHLHALGLDVGEARIALGGGRTLAAGPAEVDAESETVTLSFPEDLPAGDATLDLRWSGSFSPGLRGLYRAGALAVTQFEAADARRVFPCFDEPAFKARWKLSVGNLPDGAVAISNGPIEREERGHGGRVVHFAETPVLSSYLIALCVGELQASPEAVVRGVPLRTWAVPAKQHLTAFGQEVASSVLPLLEDYFGQPYAYGKVDQIGVPDFEAGAMENAGCITYREVALLLDPTTAPLSVQKRVAEVITHELSHQWFGNLVTMVWWDDLWLNEAFATWMAYKIVDAWRPGWKVWMDFEVGKGSALHLDALRSSHSIRAEIRNAEEATESFDAITYEKGGAILRMIEGYLGADAFRDGIRLYMKRHREGNATADDLWRALGESARGQPILELANGWIRQVGYPLVTLGERDGKLVLRQTRFFSDPDASESGAPTRWLVPVVLRGGTAAGTREVRVLLGEAEQAVELPEKALWISGNAGARGFYRTAYEPALLSRLLGAIGQLAPEERMALVSDQWALLRAGKVPAVAFLDLLAALRGEENPTVLDEIVGRLGWLEHRAVADADRPAFQRWVRELFAPQAAELGWEPAPGEPDERKLRRAAVLRAAALVGRDAGTLSAARQRLDAHLAKSGALDPNLLDVVVPAVARGANPAELEKLKAHAASELDPAARRRFLHAIAMVEDPAQTRGIVEFALSDGVQMQDFASYVSTLLANRTARDAAFGLYGERWNEVRRKGDSPMILRRLVENLGALPERRHLDAVERFLETHPLEPARQAVAQTLERLRMDVALRERLMPEIARWLGAKAG